MECLGGATCPYLGVPLYRAAVGQQRPRGGMGAQHVAKAHRRDLPPGLFQQVFKHLGVGVGWGWGARPVSRHHRQAFQVTRCALDQPTQTLGLPPLPPPKP